MICYIIAHCATHLTIVFPDTQLLFVRNALWHCGYGALWVVGPQPPSHIEEVGSRELLLALGWVLSFRNLLESLLAERVYKLDTLSSAPKVRP